MSISINDLPPEYQKQALAVLLQNKSSEQKEKRNKHGNVETQSGGVKFPSKKEARRYEELCLLQQMGKIKELKLQETFTLQNAYTTPQGERVRAITYKADFTYINMEGRKIVEDAKSPHTRTLPTYRIKKKLMLERLGINIVEV